jgi:hypothetical protein
MPYYRNPQGQVVYFSSIAFIHELPEGSQVLTDEEASAELPTPLNIAIQNKLAEVNDAWAAACQGGFVSSALGTPHRYPSTQVDQQNLASSVLASLLPNIPSTWTTMFKCTDQNGATSLVAHTAAQIQKVGQDGMLWVERCIYQLNVLETQISQAGTPEQVASFNWSNPS